MQTDAVLTMLQEVAAEVIEPRFRSLADGEVMEKNPGDLVTVADREAEVILTRRLQQAYPDALVVGEEAVSADRSILDQAASADHWFTVDPVDGTKNFVHGSPDHAVMVGEVRGAEIVRGWIWQPQHRASYVAERGAGVMRNGEPMTRVAPDLQALRGRTSRRRWVGRALPGLTPMDLSWACCGVDYPRIAEGVADYLVYGSTMPWDHVPGALIVAETGGYAGYLDGTAYDPKTLAAPLVVAAGRAAYDRVVESGAELA
ncbi:inositol monophosphatase family protein [Leekyejoonella antrihumi]|uniref:Inositol monophosphatase n=1 Tax=Leekyejoonella antrihumi TaxID=1660198 RepID=A0A563DWT2_9MICO|nr:inositol monophosphatase [Leekyejoonella antrihumi]TWP34665.1 inositol monophosphatase [Leekyejoonella antrihumi]